MHCKDISFASPQENILFDEVLFSMAEAAESGEVLRFWESPQVFIVLGRIGKAEEEIHLDQVVKDHIPVLRRCSGGGTVLQGPGCLNYSLILSKARDPRLADLRRSYEIILSTLIEIFKILNIAAVFKPVSDLALAAGEKKFSGNAQRRGKKFILHHGTILYDFDRSLIVKYLPVPKSIPEYRRHRSHDEFIANISADPGIIKQAFQKKFSVNAVKKNLNLIEQKRLNKFLDEKNVVLEPFKTPDPR